MDFTLAKLMADVGTVFEAAIGMVGTVAETVVQHPVLYIGLILGLASIGIAFYHKIKR